MKPKIDCAYAILNQSIFNHGTAAVDPETIPLSKDQKSLPFFYKYMYNALCCSKSICSHSLTLHQKYQYQN